MHAIETTVPTPVRRGRATRVAAVATAVTALVLVIGGVVGLTANVLRDGDGYFTSPGKTFTSGGYAVAMKTVDVSGAPRWAFGDAGLDTVRVEANGDRPLFVGIARAGDLDRYLDGIEHDDVAELAHDGIDYDHAAGRAPLRPPAEESFWTASVNGDGTLALDWEPTPGDWRAVLMNADGSRGITAELELGARTELLWWAGAGLLGAGILVAVAAGVLYAVSRGRR